jgi:hypothetical protein
MSSKQKPNQPHIAVAEPIQTCPDCRQSVRLGISSCGEKHIFQRHQTGQNTGVWCLREEIPVRV